MQNFDIQIKGLRQLDKLLAESLPATVARRVLLGSLKKSGEPAVNVAKATARGVRGGRSGALALSIGMISSRRGATTHPNLNPNVAAAIAIGPMSGQGATPLLAWSRYQQYYKGGNIKLKRGAPVGRIRHGHFVEFGFTTRNGRKVPGTHFLEKAAWSTSTLSASIFRSDLEKRTIRAIKRHNAKTPVRLR